MLVHRLGDGTGSMINLSDERSGRPAKRKVAEKLRA